MIILGMLCIDLSDRETGVPMCENDKFLLGTRTFLRCLEMVSFFFASWLLSFGSSRISVFHVVSKVQESIETVSFSSLLKLLPTKGLDMLGMCLVPDWRLGHI